MNRPFAYVGQSILEWMFTKPAQDAMLALGKAVQAVAGTSTFTVGLACVPTTPASMQVQVGEGEIYMMEPVEATVMATLPQDTTHQVLKQGMLRDATLLSCPAPGTVGQSIAYLVQAIYQDSDVSIDPTNGNTPVVLQFFSGTIGGTPYSGPNNTGATSNTFRKGVATVSVKAGAAAATGSQVTPAPDAGYVGLYVVTVANGAASIIAGNISAYSGAPAALPNLSQVPGDVQNQAWTYGADSGAANAYVLALTPALASYSPGQEFVFKAANTNTGASTINVSALGAKSIVRADGTPLQAGDILTGQMVEIRYDGTNFHLSPSNVHAGFSNYQVFSSSGNFTVPAGVTKVRTTVVGAGGGGGATGTTANQAGAGGGAGSTAVKLCSVTPGQVVAVTVGTGGAGGTNSGTTSGNDGSSGGSSSFGAFCSATAGAGGQGSRAAGSAAGGPGGVASGGDLNFAGAVGMDGANNTNAIGGTGAQGPWGGGGRAGTAGGGGGGSGLAPGAGGGGTYAGVSTAGGAGANGIVIVEW